MSFSHRVVDAASLLQSVPGRGRRGGAGGGSGGGSGVGGCNALGSAFPVE